MEARIGIDIANVMKQIAFIVFLPVVAGYITRISLVKRFGQKAFQETWGPRFPPLSTLGALGIALVATVLKVKASAQLPAAIFYICIPRIILYGINYYVVSTNCGKNVVFPW
jgi:ACR3 family arsenite efflux pump ArsB